MICYGWLVGFCCLLFAICPCQYSNETSQLGIFFNLWSCNMNVIVWQRVPLHRTSNGEGPTATKYVRCCQLLLRDLLTYTSSVLAGMMCWRHSVLVASCAAVFWTACGRLSEMWQCTNDAWWRVWHIYVPKLKCQHWRHSPSVDISTEGCIYLHVTRVHHASFVLLHH